MELKRLKERLKTATRGHKLLKDKTDEMIRRFVVIARENKRLRKEVETRLGNANKEFALSSAVSFPTQIQEAICLPCRKLTVKCSKTSIMNVQVPKIEVTQTGDTKYPYSFTSSTAELDASINNLDSVILSLVKLAEVEKTCNMLANEIQRNKRRVNALENVLIPQLTETIKFIRMKLDEADRSATIRLMKVKAMLLEKR